MVTYPLHCNFTNAHCNEVAKSLPEEKNAVTMADVAGYLLSKCVVFVHLVQVERASVTLLGLTAAVVENVPLKLLSFADFVALAVGEDAVLEDELVAVFRVVRLTLTQFVKFGAKFAFHR